MGGPGKAQGSLRTSLKGAHAPLLCESDEGSLTDRGRRRRTSDGTEMNSSPSRAAERFRCSFEDL